MLIDNSAEITILWNIAYLPQRQKEIFSEISENDFGNNDTKSRFIFAKSLFEKKANMENREIKQRIFPEKFGKATYKLYDAIESVKNFSYRRNLVAMSTYLSSCANDFSISDSDIKNLVAEKIKEGLLSKGIKSRSKNLSSVIDSLVINLQKEPMRHVTWGFPALDFARLEPGTLVSFAARPGTGKTAFITSSCLKMARRNIKTGVICIEMDNEQIALRMMAQTSGYSYSQIRYHYAELSKEQLDRTKNTLKNVSCRLFCGNKVSMVDIEEIATEWVFRGVEVIFIDYLQLIDHKKGEKRYISVGETSKEIKMLARRLEIPIVLLAQLNREAADTQPKVHHLKESGAIEENSDIVILLDAKNKPNDPFIGRNYVMESDIGFEKVDMDRHAAIIVDKNRNGPTGVFYPKYDRSCMEFS